MLNIGNMDFLIASYFFKWNSLHASIMTDDRWKLMEVKTVNSNIGSEISRIWRLAF